MKAIIKVGHPGDLISKGKASTLIMQYNGGSHELYDALEKLKTEYGKAELVTTDVEIPEYSVSEVMAERRILG